MTKEPGSDAEKGEAAAARRSSVAGRIESLGLPVILQFLSQKQKTGRLALTRREGHGSVLFHEGRIVAVSSGGVRDSFGNMLVCRDLISEADLMEAIEKQHLSLEPKRLGEILIEAGKVASEDVERVVREQMKTELALLMDWPAGFFRFDPMSIDGPHDVELEARDYLSSGVSAERLLFSLAQQEESSPEPEEPSPSEEEEGTSVSALLSELPVPALRGEVTLTLMRFAEQTVARGVLYLVRGDQLVPLVAFGFSEAGGDTQASLSGLGLKLENAAILGEVLLSRESYLGPVTPPEENGGLLRVLGGGTKELLAIPLVVGGVAAGLFCGDNGPAGRSVRGVRLLELVVAEAGLEMERAAVEARLERYKAAVPETKLLRGS